MGEVTEVSCANAERCGLSKAQYFVRSGLVGEWLR